MTTSNSYNFNMTAGDICREALEHIVVQLPGEPVDADNLKTAMTSLNMMIKGGQALGIGLWLNRKINVFLPKNAQSVLLGPTGGNVTLASGMVTSTLSAGAAQGASALTLASITGLASGMYIGIQLDGGTMQWTTINGAPGATVALTDALTGPASSGNVIYAYTSKIQRPKSVIEFRRVDYVTGTEIPLIAYSRDEYMSLPLKATVGTPVGYYYDPQLVNGELYVWPTVDTVQTRLIGTVRWPVQDFDLSTNDADFPPEWYEALSYNLALRLGTKFAVPKDVWDRVVLMAGATLQALEGFDTEDTSTFFTVATRW